MAEALVVDELCNFVLLEAYPQKHAMGSEQKEFVNKDNPPHATEAFDIFHLICRRVGVEPRPNVCIYVKAISKSNPELIDHFILYYDDNGILWDCEGIDSDCLNPDYEFHVELQRGEPILYLQYGLDYDGMEVITAEYFESKKKKKK